jgi:hypothetical protein
MTDIQLITHKGGCWLAVLLLINLLFVLFACKGNEARVASDSVSVAASKKPAQGAKINSRLLAMAEEVRRTGSGLVETAARYGFKTDTGLLLDIQLEDKVEEPGQAIAAAGGEVTFLSREYRRATVRITDIKTLAELASLRVVRFIDPVYPPLRR